MSVRGRRPGVSAWAGAARGRGERPERAVAIIQRFGGALNLNIHVHALVIDGVFAHEAEGLRFHPACRLTRDDVAAVVAVVAQRIDRLLQRRGLVATSEARAATPTHYRASRTGALLFFGRHTQ